MLSRRNFLRSGTLTALSITLAMKAGRTAFGQSSTQNSALDFPISDTARQQPLFNYTKIMTTKARSTDAFALSFNASRLMPAFTTIYALNHPVLGKFDLFMTLRKCDDGALFYDAVVNHAL